VKTYLARLYSEKAKITLEETVEAVDLADALIKAIKLVSVGNHINPERDFCVKAVTVIVHACC